MKHAKELTDILNFAKDNGLKRLKVGSIEVEISDYELTMIYTARLQASNLTPTKGATSTPSPTAEATNSTQLPEDDEEALLFHSSDPA